MNNFKLEIRKDRKEYKLDKIDADNIYKYVLPNISYKAKLMLLGCNYDDSQFNNIKVKGKIDYLFDIIPFNYKTSIKHKETKKIILEYLYEKELCDISFSLKKGCYFKRPFTSLIVSNKYIEICMDKEVYNALQLYKQDIINKIL